MNSIAEIFDNSKQLLDSIDIFLISTLVVPFLGSTVSQKWSMTYFDNPISRLLGNLK